MRLSAIPCAVFFASNILLSYPPLQKTIESDPCGKTCCCPTRCQEIKEEAKNLACHIPLKTSGVGIKSTSACETGGNDGIPPILRFDTVPVSGTSVLRAPEGKFPILGNDSFVEHSPFRDPPDHPPKST